MSRTAAFAPIHVEFTRLLQGGNAEGARDYLKKILADPSVDVLIACQALLRIGASLDTTAGQPFFMESLRNFLAIPKEMRYTDPAMLGVRN